MHQLRITVVEPFAVHEHILRESPVVLGRLSTNEVVIADPRVSRMHVQFEWEGDKLHVRDMGSGNRTLLLCPNGEEKEVNRGGIRCPSGAADVQIGSTRVRVRLERLHMSYVPNDVIAAARTASERLRNTRTESPPPSSIAHGISFHDLASIGHSVLELRKALLVDLPSETRQIDRPSDDARNALVEWTHEVMDSLVHFANQYTTTASPPPLACSEDVAIEEDDPLERTQPGVPPHELDHLCRLSTRTDEHVSFARAPARLVFPDNPQARDTPA